MNCIPELAAMEFLDGELDPSQAAEIQDHMLVCAACRSRIAALEAENTLLADVLQTPAPKRHNRARIFQHIAASVAASIVAAAPFQLMSQFVSEQTTLRHLGAAMVDFPFELAYRAARALGVLLLLVVILQAPAHALTRRSGQGPVVIGAQETIADTVLATGDTVVVEGTIDGTLLLFGRSLEIRGHVNGDVIAGGQEVRITGNVDGNVVAFSQSVLIQGEVTRNVYSGARTLQLDRQAHIGQDLVTGAQEITADGIIGRSLVAGAENILISGMINRSVTFAAAKLVVRPGAQIDGAIRGQVNAREDVQVDPKAIVRGGVDVSLNPRPRSRWVRPGFYVFELAWLLSAFLMGWVLSRVFPSFFEGSVQRIRSWALSGGIGFAILIVTPVAAILLAITLVGLPFAFAAMALYCAGLFLAKIFVGAYLGRELLGLQPGRATPAPIALFAGLLIVTVLMLLPFGVGGILRLIVLCLGLGAFALQLKQSVVPAA